MSQFIFPPLTASLDSEQTNGGSLPAKQMIIGGYDGANVRAIKVDAAGDLQVDVVSSMPLPTGAATSALQTAGNNILTTIDADTSALAGAVSGTEVQVDVVASLPAGTNAIGKLAANSGVDIGDVDVTSLPSIPTGTNSIGTVGLDAGTNAIGKLVANSGVDIGDVDVTSVIPGVGATNLGKAIQSAQGTTDTGVPALVVRNDTLADLSGADGDYAPIQVNATGAVYTVLSAGTAVFGKLAANSGVDIGDVDVTSSALPTGAATSALQTSGNNLLTTIDADTSSLAGCVSGTEVQVDVVSGSITVTNSMTPVDFLDAGVFDASTGTNIPSTGSATLVTLAADCKEIEVIDDIGEYMSLRVGGAVKAYLPLGGGRVKCHLSTGNAVTLYSETGTTINSGKIAMNFLA